MATLGWRQYFRDDSSFVPITTADIWNAFYPGIAPPAGAFPIRLPLFGPITFYVSNAGSDSNNGLTPGTPFLTIGHALANLANYDARQQAIIIQCADGTYNENIALPNVLGAYIGGGLGAANPTLIGNIATPSNCVINGSGVIPTVLIFGSAANDWILRGFKITNGGTGGGIETDENSWLRLGEMEYGAVGGGFQLQAINGGTLEPMAKYEISAGAATHLQTSFAGRLLSVGVPVILTGTPAFTVFTLAGSNSLQSWGGSTFSGAATGIRFSNDTGSGLATAGGGVNFFPGNAPGTTTAPGWYT